MLWKAKISHTLPCIQLCEPKCNTYDNQYGLEVSFEAYQSIFGLLYDTDNISDQIPSTMATGLNKIGIYSE
jgi:hypothetical protein